MKSKFKLIPIGLVGLILALALGFGIEKIFTPANSGIKLDIPTTQVLRDGTEIIFSQKHPGLGQFKLETVKKERSLLDIQAPAQVVASFQRHAILFSHADISSLYSQYIQGLANFEKLQKNEARVSDMFQNQAATARDLNDAKTEAINAKSIKTDLELRLKTAGLEPIELKKERPKKVWLLAEVPENQLHEVDKGEEVKTVFLSFPGQVFLWQVAA